MIPNLVEIQERLKKALEFYKVGVNSDGRIITVGDFYWEWQMAAYFAYALLVGEREPVHQALLTDPGSFYFELTLEEKIVLKTNAAVIELVLHPEGGASIFWDKPTPIPT